MINRVLSRLCAFPHLRRLVSASGIACRRVYKPYVPFIQTRKLDTKVEKLVRIPSYTLLGTLSTSRLKLPAAFAQESRIGKPSTPVHSIPAGYGIAFDTNPYYLLSKEESFVLSSEMWQ
jgi:hypothetical protein